MMSDVESSSRRGTQPRTRSGAIRTRWLVGTALSAALALSGCSGISADEAAVIDGRSIGESELQEATSQLNTISAEPAGPSDILDELTRTPILDRVFTGTSAELTDQEVKELLSENGLANPSDLSVDVARTRQYLGMLQDPEITSDPEMEEALRQLQDITPADLESLVSDLNPRYGTFDTESLSIVPSAPEWISPAG